MRIYFKTFGCRVNQIETESISEKLDFSNIERVDNLNDCDLIFINTCSVTKQADKDVHKLISKASKLGKKIAVSGCYASLFPEKILEINPSVKIITNEKKYEVPKIISGVEAQDDFFAVKGSYGKTRAFIKVQDGCDLKCAYCIVPFARNKIKSKDSLKVKEEIENLILLGFKEISISGTRLGCYLCPSKKINLKGLLKEIFSIKGDFRIRLSSLEPMEIDEELLKILAEAGDKFCDHFHISIQHFSVSVLKEMLRPYDGDFVFERIALIKKYFPMAGIYADIIAGFPKETEEDFSKGFSLIKKSKLSGLHPFAFSARPFTLAAKMPQIDEKVILKRSLALRKLDAQLREDFLRSMLKKSLKCLILKKKDGFFGALSSNFINIIVQDENLRKNSFAVLTPKAVSGKNLIC